MAKNIELLKARQKDAKIWSILSALLGVACLTVGGGIVFQEIIVFLNSNHEVSSKANPTTFALVGFFSLAIGLYSLIVSGVQLMNAVRISALLTEEE